MIVLFTAAIAAQSQTRKFIVGVEQIDYLPFYGNENDKYTGYAREFFDAFAKEKGYILHYKILPVKRLYLEFFENTIDFKFPDSPFWQQEAKKDQKIHYSNPVCEYIDGLMIHKDNLAMTAERLSVIGTVRGFTAWDYLDMISSGRLQLNENNSLQGLLQQIEMKRIDGGYVNIAVAEKACKDSGSEGNLVFADKLPHTRGAYLCSTIKYPEIIAELNSFIESRQDIINELLVKYKIETAKKIQQTGSVQIKPADKQ